LEGNSVTILKKFHVQTREKVWRVSKEWRFHEAHRRLSQLTIVEAMIDEKKKKKNSVRATSMTLTVVRMMIRQRKTTKMKKVRMKMWTIVQKLMTKLWKEVQDE
jgi:hypothetical protein